MPPADQEISIYQQIYRVVRQIPEGSVATYGQIARLVGRPRGARQVGYALAASAGKEQLPWHRVINAKGEVSARADPGGEHYQRLLLEAEGIFVDENGRVSLARYRWEPVEDISGLE